MATAPSAGLGQMNRPCSNRFAYNDIPTPSCQRTFIAVPRRPRKTKRSPACGSRPSPCCTWSANPSMPRRPVHASPHVGHAAREPDAQSRGNRDHARRPSTWRTRAKAAASKSGPTMTRYSLASTISMRPAPPGTEPNGASQAISGASLLTNAGVKVVAADSDGARRTTATPRAHIAEPWPIHAETPQSSPRQSDASLPPSSAGANRS